MYIIEIKHNSTINIINDVNNNYNLNNNYNNYNNNYNNNIIADYYYYINNKITNNNYNNTTMTVDIYKKCDKNNYVSVIVINNNKIIEVIILINNYKIMNEKYYNNIIKKEKIIKLLLLLQKNNNNNNNTEEELVIIIIISSKSALTIINNNNNLIIIKMDNNNNININNNSFNLFEPNNLLINNYNNNNNNFMQFKKIIKKSIINSYNNLIIISIKIIRKFQLLSLYENKLNFNISINTIILLSSKTIILLLLLLKIIIALINIIMINAAVFIKLFIYNNNYINKIKEIIEENIIIKNNNNNMIKEDKQTTIISSTTTAAEAAAEETRTTTSSSTSNYIRFDDLLKLIKRENLLRRQRLSSFYQLVQYNNNNNEISNYSNNNSRYKNEKNYDQLVINNLNIIKDAAEVKLLDNNNNNERLKITQSPLSLSSSSTLLKSDNYVGPANNNSWNMIMWPNNKNFHRMGLCGGGEGSLNNGTSGWGSPPGAGAGNNPNAGNWNTSNTQPTSSSWSNSGQTTGGGGGSNNNVTGNNGGGGGGPVGGNNNGNNNNQSGQRLSSSQQQQQSDQNSNKNSNQQSQSSVGVGSSGGGGGGVVVGGVNVNQAGQQQQQQQNSNANNPGGGGPIGNNGNNWNNQGVVVGGGIQNQKQNNSNGNQPSGGVQQPGNNNSGNPNANGNNIGGPGLAGGGTSTAAAKNQLEQLNTMREALYSQDGWGCQHVNQDTNWDVPGSPEPGIKNDPSGGPLVWKPNINNGTELWEANLRNGGQPPPQPVTKSPWSHTPSSNLGGTWGEDDDSGDTGNVWTGAPTNPQGPQWTQPAAGMWPAAAAAAPGGVGAGAGNGQNTGGGVGGGGGGPKKENEWSGATSSGSSGGGGGGVSGGGGNGGNSGNQGNSGGGGGNGGGGGANNWDPRDIRGAPMDMRNVDPRDMRAPGADPREIRMVDPRDQMRDMRGDPRGISGRLNGSSEMWGQHHGITQHGQMPINKMVGPGAASGNGQWSGNQVTGPKDIGGMNKQSGWEEPSPPAQRRNMPNFDDGTSLWSQQQPRVPGVSHWKDLPDMSRNNMIRNTVPGQANISGAAASLPQGRIGPAGPGGMKPDNTMWGHSGARNGAWEEPHTQNWTEDKAPVMGGSNASWNDTAAAATWAKNKIALGGGSQVWQESGELPEWAGHGGPKPQQKMGGGGAVDHIRNSKQLRVLCDLGFKKEEAELALRTTNMNLDEAIEMLNQQRATSGGGNGGNTGMDTWRRHDDHTFEHNTFPGRYGPSGPQPNTMNFPPTNNPNILNNMGGGGSGGGNPSLATITNMQPIQVQKYLNQGPHNAATAQSAFNAPAAATQSPNQPSTQQLRMLVQQIQMAVQAGYLNHQILNQPLAPQTLVLLNQLLNNIKQLQLTQANLSRGGVNGLQVTVTITKLKQQISNLQNQITTQQAIYVKQQQASAHVGGGNEFLRTQHDQISSLQGNFTDMSLNKEQQGYQASGTNQQSRLNQWKLPALDKDAGGDPTDFSRAPGTTAKSTLSTANAAMGSLGLQNDGTWSTGRGVNDGWPDPSVETDNKDWPVAQPSPAAAFTDLVPEFEPGKPWKGSQIKTIEDDPSITPGSVARSPLSISAAKESDLFTGSSKTSPTDLQPISLSSNTWAFNPAGQQNYGSSISKMGTKSSSWNDNVPQQASSASELWAPMSKAPRGPPPGLGANKASTVGGGVGGSGVSGISNTTSAANGWMNAANLTVGRNTNWSTNTNGNWHSAWLLLKNLTAQIDGSTLRTLCMQHGPLASFHLYLNHGIALCRYSSREEANKAQMALNNCVLGNTTICAESPSESEVQNILQHLSAPGAQPNSAGASVATPAWRPPTQQAPSRATGSDTWGSGSVVWQSPNPGNNLWTPLDGTTERGTPSSLNSFLPESLLGAELN